MKRMHLFSILMMITVYSIASLLVDRSFLLPSLLEIGHSFFKIITTSSFSTIVLSTLTRVLVGFSISFLLAFLLATGAFYKKGIKEFMEPVYLFLKTIPNITYIIVSLIWLGRNGSVVLVCFLVIFPLMYQSFLKGYERMDPELLEVAKLYGENFWETFLHVYLPLIQKDIVLAMQNSLSLGLKVSIMAEILGQVTQGIGKEMYFAKINYMMSDIFAWTLVIVLLSFLLDYLFGKVVRRLDV